MKVFLSYHVKDRAAADGVRQGLEAAGLEVVDPVGEADRGDNLFELAARALEGAQAMVITAKARALLAGRYNVSTADIVSVARPSLRHRIILNFEGEAEGMSTDSILDEVLESVTVAH